ncbi:MAG: 2-C-methyl-D-erythritol 4-phosphate cytidylyltransferase, partial [Paludibacter sp.]
MNNPKITIIVAGGKGERMQTDIPKQFIEIQGKPILMHSIESFLHFDLTMQIIVVLPLSQIDFWKELCIKHAFNVTHLIVFGGQSRFESV